MKNDITTPIKCYNEEFYNVVAKCYIEKNDNKLKDLEEKFMQETLDTSGLDNKLFEALSKIDPEYKTPTNISADDDIGILDDTNIPDKSVLIPQNKNKIIIIIAKYTAACLFILTFSYILVYFNYTKYQQPKDELTNNSSEILNINEISPEELYKKYNKIKLGMPLEEFELLFNSFKPFSKTESEISKSYRYVTSNSNIYLYVSFDDSNKVDGKAFDDRKYILFKANAENPEKSNSVIKGMSYQQIRELFGSDGYNISENDSIFTKGYTESTKRYIWIFDDMSGIEIDFYISNDKEEVWSFRVVPPLPPPTLYDIFISIKEGMTINDVKSFFDSEPIIVSKENIIEYKFDNTVSIGYDNTNLLVYKSFDYSKNPMNLYLYMLESVSLDEFSEIKNGMSLKEVEDIIGSDGLFIKETFNDDIYNKTYIWIFKDIKVEKDSYVFCSFNKENKLVSIESIEWY